MFKSKCLLILISLFSILNSTEVGKSDLNNLLFSENIERVQYAINEKNSNVNIRNELGNTPLMHAVINNRVDIVRLLIFCIADLDLSGENKEGKTILYLAANCGNKEIEKIVKNRYEKEEKRKSEENIKKLFSANVEEVQESLDAGTDINFQNGFGNTPLMHAAESNRKSIMQLLIDRKAKVNVQSRSGFTALMLASHFGHSEIVTLLLNVKADLSIKNKYGQTAIEMAEASGNNEIVALLKKASETKS